VKVRLKWRRKRKKRKSRRVLEQKRNREFQTEDAYL
jgi:hypothetical protein